jgi:hypothetical protein
MLRRFTSILVLLITLMIFFVTTAFAENTNVHKKKPVKKEHVVKKKTHKIIKHKSSKKVHKTLKKSRKMKKKVKLEREDSRIKVN